jgi:hypothetical protein
MRMSEQQWGPKIDELAISIYVTRPTYSAGDQIDLHLGLKNFGSSPFILVRLSAWADYSLAVRKENGAGLLPTPYVQQRLEAAMEGRQATSELQPGEMTQDSLELDRAYDLREPGRYTVRATRRVFRRSNYQELATLTSNELVIELVESGPPR